jgi:hypothetical protein
LVLLHEEDEEDEEEHDEQDAPPPKKTRVTGVAMFLGLDSWTTTETAALPPASEVDKYLALPQQRAILPSGAEASPLEWWKGQASGLPHLAKMARQFLALPASSAGCERLFHAAGRMHDDLKKSTTDETMQRVLNVYANT